MRLLAAVSGILFGGLSDQASLPEFSYDGDLPLDAAPGALCRDSARGSIADRDRSKGRCKTTCHILANGKLSDGEQLQSRVAFSPEGETGQTAVVMSAY
jgi:hypothetical protein